MPISPREHCSIADKVIFTEEDAKSSARRSTREGVPMLAYLDPRCDHWHITKSVRARNLPDITEGSHTFLDMIDRRVYDMLVRELGRETVVYSVSELYNRARSLDPLVAKIFSLDQFHEKALKPLLLNGNHTRPAKSSRPRKSQEEEKMVTEEKSQKTAESAKEGWIGDKTDEPLKCDLCDFTTHSKRGLTIHKSHVHKDEEEEAPPEKKQPVHVRDRELLPTIMKDMRSALREVLAEQKMIQFEERSSSVSVPAREDLRSILIDFAAEVRGKTDPLQVVKDLEASVDLLLDLYKPEVES